MNTTTKIDGVHENQRNNKLRETELIETLKEQLDISHKLHDNEFQKVRRYEKALCAILNIVAEQGENGIFDIITDALQGHELMDQYEEDALEGIHLLGNSL